MASARETVDLAPLLAPLRRMGYTDAMLTPVVNAVRQMLASDSRENFASSSDPDAKPWRPLKRRKGKPLLDRGVLRGSVTTKAEGPRVIQGSAQPYASFHQRGTRRIPRRRFLGAGARVEPKVRRLLDDFVRRAMEGP
jgi:phage gpG-like protein